MPIKRTLKRGILSANDKAYIINQCEKQSPEVIANKLRRPVAIIERYISTLTGLNLESHDAVAERLTHSPYWAELETQFNESELGYFKKRYVHYMGQFAKDEEIPPTEELQVFNLITIEILIHQTLYEQKFSRDDMLRVRSELEQERKAGGDKELLYNLESRYETARAASKMYNDRLNNFYAKESSLLKELKSTRDQRIKEIDNNDQNFASFLKTLTTEEGKLRLGEEAEIHVLAMNKEAKRLSAPFKFADGVTDQPLLTPETVTDNYET